MRKRSAARLGRALFVLPVAAVSQSLLANTGVQIPLSQYQAGAEQTTQVPNGNFGTRADTDGDGRFETASGWDRTGNLFVESTVNPPANTAATSPFSAQARLVDNVQPGSGEQSTYIQPIDRATLTPNANYVMSGYVWNMGRPDPSGNGAGDLVSIKVQDPSNSLGNNISLTLEGNGANGDTAASGRFMYMTVNESQLRAWGGAELALVADVGTVAGTLPEVWAQWDNVSLTRSDAFAGQKWTGTGGGNFGDGTKWQSGFVPSGAGSVAALIGSAGPQTVTLEAERTLGILRLGGTGSYTVAGAPITLQVTDDGGGAGLPEIVVDSGSHTVSAPVTMARNGILHVATGANLNVTSDLTTTDVSLTKIGGGTATVTNVRTGTAGVAVDAGTLKIAPNGTAAGASKTATLAIAPGARLDLSDNKLVTSTPAGTATGGVYEEGSVHRMVQTAYQESAWSGPGLMTSMDDAKTGLTTIAIATGEQIGRSEFAGQSVAPTDTVAFYTYGGDTNFDGKLDADDYGTIDFNVLLPGPIDGYYNGDFNYDGVVNADDYGVIDFNILAQTTPFSTGGASVSGVAAVPEPSTFGLAVAAAAMLGARRRRRIE